MMIKWMLLLPLVYFCTLLGYLLNPIVVLFCNEEGELPSFLHYFQTWDDSVYSEFFVKECAPQWLNYNYNDHYIPITRVNEYGGTVNYNVLKQGARFTVKQRLQRYLCGVAWLYRNCAYGFCYNLFGSDVSGMEFNVKNNNNFWGKNDKGVFVYKNENPINNHLNYKIYIGWKTYPNNTSKRGMFAYRVSLSLKGV